MTLIDSTKETEVRDEPTDIDASNINAFDIDAFDIDAADLVPAKPEDRCRLNFYPT